MKSLSPSKNFLYLSAVIMFVLQFIVFSGQVFSEDLSDRVSAKLETLNLSPHDFDISNYLGEVTISGWASSEEDRRIVLKTISQVKGVDKIEESIVIKKTNNVTLGDNVDLENKLNQVKVASENYLKSSKLSGPYNLHYETNEQGVLISGELPAGAVKETLLVHIRQQVNIPVNERILVRPWPTDTELTEKVRYDIGTRQGINLEGISIAVSKGIVTLSGHRSNHNQADQLAAAVMMVEGVRGLKSEVSFDGSRNDP